MDAIGRRWHYQRRQPGFRRTSAKHVFSSPDELVPQSSQSTATVSEEECEYEGKNDLAKKSVSLAREANKSTEDDLRLLFLRTVRAGPRFEVG